MHGATMNILTMYFMYNLKMAIVKRRNTYLYFM